MKTEEETSVGRARTTYFLLSHSSPSGTGRYEEWRACVSYDDLPRRSPAGCPCGRRWPHPGRRQPSLQWVRATRSGSAAGRQEPRAGTTAIGGLTSLPRCWRAQLHLGRFKVLLQEGPSQLWYSTSFIHLQQPVNQHPRWLRHLRTLNNCISITKIRTLEMRQVGCKLWILVQLMFAKK